MFKELYCLIALMVCIHALPAPQPQDPAGMAMMAVMKGVEIMENGAAAGTHHSAEFMGARVGSGMDVGFGEAARRNRRDTMGNGMGNGMGRRRSRSPNDFSTSSSSSSSSSYSSSDSDE